MARAFKLGLIGASAVVLAACSSTKSAEKLLNPDPPDKMYLIADALLTRGRYEDAAQKFEDLDRDHPYSQEARHTNRYPHARQSGRCPTA